MKYLLIAVYLAHGTVEPVTRHQQVPDKATCQDKAERYVKRNLMGHARAFCVQLKEPLK